MSCLSIFGLQFFHFFKFHLSMVSGKINSSAASISNDEILTFFLICRFTTYRCVKNEFKLIFALFTWYYKILCGKDLLTLKFSALRNSGLVDRECVIFSFILFYLYVLFVKVSFSL